MKTILKRGIGLAVVIMLMIQCAPVLGTMMTAMFGQYENLADSVVAYDSNGNIQLNGEPADAMLINLGTKAESVTTELEQKAGEVINTAAEETEVSEEDKASFEELKVKARDFLNEINKFFS